MIFPVISPKALVSITYLLVNPNLAMPVDQIVSYVDSEEGAAKRIPVMLQRVFGPWALVSGWILLALGFWVAVNLTISLVGLLARLYY
jgi:hypothetical protein